MDYSGKSRGKRTVGETGKRATGKRAKREPAAVSLPFSPVTLEFRIFPVNFFLVRLRGNFEFRILNRGFDGFRNLQSEFTNRNVSIPKHPVTD